jgi:hypothetical protein
MFKKTPMTMAKAKAETCRGIINKKKLCNKLVLNFTYVIQLHGKCTTLIFQETPFGRGEDFSWEGETKRT